MKNEKLKGMDIKAPTRTTRLTTDRPAGRIISRPQKNTLSMDIAPNKKISHFAPTVKQPTQPISPVKPQAASVQTRKMDIGPMKHPIVAKVEEKLEAKKVAAKQAITPKTSKELKDAAIAEAFSKIKEVQQEKRQAFKRRSKLFSIVSFVIVLLLIMAFFLYFYLPNISIQFANAKAGIEATYPDYCPDGYSLNGPISYSNGQVVINFKSNSDNSNFSIKQTKSSWDSNAVKEQVTKESNGDLNATQESGLTIYTYNNNHNAAWVNGGILYGIDGNAPLSGDQIRRIAISL